MLEDVTKFVDLLENARKEVEALCMHYNSGVRAGSLYLWVRGFDISQIPLYGLAIAISYFNRPCCPKHSARDQ